MPERSEKHGTCRSVGIRCMRSLAFIPLLFGRAMGALLFGQVNVMTARILLEMRLQEEEARGDKWESSVVNAYHRLCFLEGIQGYDKIPQSHVEEFAQSLAERNLAELPWLRMRLKRGEPPSQYSIHHDMSCSR